MSKDFMCQASDGNSEEDDIASAIASALQSEPCAEAYYDALMAIATYPITLTKPPENMDAFNMQLIAQGALEGFSVPRPMVGIFNTLSPEQQAAVLAYDGPEYLGSVDGSQIEEPGTGDEVERYEFKPDWELTTPEKLVVALTLAIAKFAPECGGFTDEELQAVSEDVLVQLRERDRGQLEEQAASPRSDEVDAGNKSASLTQNPTSLEQIAREIAKTTLRTPSWRTRNDIGLTCRPSYFIDDKALEDLFASALLTVQKRERERATRWRNDCGILLAQLDYLSEATGENLDCQDAGLVEQIRTDYAASIRQGDDNAS